LQLDQDEVDRKIEAYLGILTADENFAAKINEGSIEDEDNYGFNNPGFGD
jgi:hypothetical protein